MELIEVKQFGKLVGVVDDSEWAGGVRAGRGVSPQNVSV